MDRRLVQDVIELAIRLAPLAGDQARQQEARDRICEALPGLPRVTTPINPWNKTLATTDLATVAVVVLEELGLRLTEQARLERARLAR